MMIVIFPPSRSERSIEPFFALGLPMLVQEMWSAATTTPTPSGSFRPSLTITFRSEPSGFAENMRPPPRSRKNRRPAIRLIPDCALILQLQQLLLSNALWMQKVDDQYIRPRDGSFEEFRHPRRLSCNTAEHTNKSRQSVPNPCEE